ncbi:MAG: LPS export ABC transporter periplasmic protein LptC [Rhodospirillales bacterium]|nr:LPS export ABC transporter periplasmic protein LptC [Rhodospirillales bacterium]
MEKEQSNRLQHLNRPRKIESTARYTRFVRWMRVVLPLMAVGIVGILMAWPRVEETFEAIPKENLIPQAVIGKNELVSPRFESEDESQQPFTITATRALQSSDDPDMVLLEQPMADITLKSGDWIAVESQKGTYRQEKKQLMLTGAVKLFHDQGYELQTEKLLVDLQAQEAWSDQPVSGHGPAGTLQASGMQAENISERLIFTGPAKLVLNRAIKGIE